MNICINDIASKWLLFVIMILFYNNMFCQNFVDKLKYPIVGEPCPDFVIRNIENFPEKEVKLKGSVRSRSLISKGKWTVLDFWNKGCGSCIASFPKLNKFYMRFKPQTNFILIGLEDKEEEIRPMFASYKKKLGLIFPYAFDSVLYKHRLDLYSAPHIIIIDPKGIVRAITSSVTEDQMQSLLEGKVTQFAKSYYRTHEESEEEKRATQFDPSEVFLIHGNGGRDDDNFLYRSLFSKWDNSMPFTGGTDLTSSPFTRIAATNYGALQKFDYLQVLGVSLADLYNMAYFGKDRPTSDSESLIMARRPLLDLKNKLPFDDDLNTGKGRYCYSLLVPRFKQVGLSLVQSIMQIELKATFGYDVTIEQRNAPYYKLVFVDSVYKTKLKAKGDTTYFRQIIRNSDFAARNIPVKKLIKYFNLSGDQRLPILDSTGIEGNIDIDYTGIRNELNSINESLRVNGLQLILDSLEVKTLVIRDPQPRLYKKPIDAIAADDSSALALLLLPGSLSKSELDELFVRCIENDSQKCFELLVTRGAGINGPEERFGNMTPLMIAAYYGRIKMVKVLVAGGVKINVTYKSINSSWTQYNGMTALDFARKYRHNDVEDFLIALGAN